MPYVILPNEAEMYYTISRAGAAKAAETGAPSSTAPSPDHPTLVMLSPSWLDVTYLDGILNDELRRDYNIVCFDLLSHGRTRSTPNGNYDHAVGAATIAFAMESLRIPPSHLFGSGAIAFHVALKFVLLFPSQVLSLSLAGITGLFSPPPPDRVAALVELTRTWSFPQDEEDYYEGLDAMSMMFLSADGDVDLSDEIVGALVRRYSPYQLRRTYEVSAANHQASRITKKALASIRAPVLVIHGTEDVVFPISSLEDIRDAFTNAKEVAWEPIEGGPHMVALTHSKLVSSLLSSFLARQSTFAPSAVPFDFPRALKVASEMSGNPRIVDRNPGHPESYCLLSLEERERATRTLEEYGRLEQQCTLQLPGIHEPEPWEEAAQHRRQPWKFSTRNDNVQRSPASRQSLVGSISVKVETSLPPIPVSPPDDSLRNLHLDDVAPPVPPKDGADSPSWGGSQWLSSQTVRTSSH